ncbi:MAG: acyl carrier protein [Planctomycetaceae bacterium]
MIDITEVTTDIIDYLQTGFAGKQPITPQTDLLEADILDSLLIMDVLAFVESRYGVRFGDSEIAPRHFRTVDCLVRLVAYKLLRPLKAECLLCKEVDAFPTLEELDAPSLLASDTNPGSLHASTN